MPKSRNNCYKVVTATDMRNQFNKLIEGVVDDSGPVVVTVAKKPKVAIVNYQYLEELRYLASINK